MVETNKAIIEVQKLKEELKSIEKGITEQIHEDILNEDKTTALKKYRDTIGDIERKLFQIELLIVREG